MLPCFARIQHELFERCRQRVGHRINDQLVKVLAIRKRGLLAELPQPAVVGGLGLFRSAPGFLLPLALLPFQAFAGQYLCQNAYSDVLAQSEHIQIQAPVGWDSSPRASHKCSVQNTRNTGT